MKYKHWRALTRENIAHIVVKTSRGILILLYEIVSPKEFVWNYKIK